MCGGLEGAPRKHCCFCLIEEGVDGECECGDLKNRFVSSSILCLVYAGRLLRCSKLILRPRKFDHNREREGAGGRLVTSFLLADRTTEYEYGFALL